MSLDLLEPKLIAGDHENHIMDLGYARDLWRAILRDQGYTELSVKATMPMLTRPGSNTKLAKNDLITYGLTLAPHENSGVVNLCPHASPGCASACLFTAGRGRFGNVAKGRITRTLFLASYPGAAITLIQHEIDLAVNRHGSIAMRLNVLSDLRWELIMPSWFTRWGSAVTFYDYTKWPRRDVPDNYHLTYSWHEKAKHLEKKLENFDRVAVVFDEIPESWHGIPCVNGDESDQRWDDTRVIVALKAKGDAKHDDSGFVQKLS